MKIINWILKLFRKNQSINQRIVFSFNGVSINRVKEFEMIMRVDPDPEVYTNIDPAKVLQKLLPVYKYELKDEYKSIDGILK